MINNNRRQIVRRRSPRRRGISSAENLSELPSTTHSPELLTRLTAETMHIDCTGSSRVCGGETACRQINHTASICVCPHDSSLPTPDMKCPTRIVVPKPPKPIHNIIPPSGNINDSSTVHPEAEQVEQARQKVPEIVGIAVGCFLVLAIVTSVIYCYRRRNYNAKSKRNSLDNTPRNLKKSLLLDSKSTRNPQYFACSSPEVPLLQRDSLVFLQDIGEGCFGKVYKGELQYGESVEIVAVKVLKESASREVEDDFMREVDIMSTFRHPNILLLKGVVLREIGHSPWMVFEYMPYGDLTEVLRANSPHHFRSSRSDLEPLTRESLHWIITQIAEGMMYLSTQRFVHRDLACRNCLVGYGLIVKIADFGMSRDVYTCDYYKMGGSRLLPVRWMSPESVMYGRFTLESDVWSFGVVLWEVYSFGKQPYYGHNNEEVVKLILQGIMLIPPEDSPPYVCQIMKDCWKTEPRDRLRFPDVLEYLRKAEEAFAEMETLPRPPQGPVTLRTPDVLDPDGYLLPAPAKICEYWQPLPPIADEPTVTCT
ncbi:muscle, skeletal receptor tyrosine protein kinase-like [Belonocnema kinseyi]|uniref:muscle, skeletal receptor tyrosine protein kinase-like n=1 Tax=Belonocnema kinseyi TaxID=2817044 RepID=UPI00143CE4AE|nr:muscle, skeletal receptor tyrosine protein kinase-like [Belonocnema kinseyi]